MALAPSTVRFWSIHDGVGATVRLAPKDEIDTARKIMSAVPHLPPPLSRYPWEKILTPTYIVKQEQTPQGNGPTLHAPTFSIELDDVRADQVEVEMLRALSVLQPAQRREAFIGLVVGRLEILYEAPWGLNTAQPCQLENPPIFQANTSSEIGPLAAAANYQEHLLELCGDRRYLGVAPVTVASDGTFSPYIVASALDQTRELAKIKAVSEAAERSSLYPSTLELARMEECPRARLQLGSSYEDYYHFTADQIQRDPMKRNGDPKDDVRTIFTEDTTGPIFRICDEVLFPRARFQRGRRSLVNSSGTAAHFTFRAAFEAATRELIERHFFMKWWTTGMVTGELIKYDQIPCKTATRDNPELIFLNIGKIRSCNESIILSIAWDTNGLAAGLASGKIDSPEADETSAFHIAQEEALLGIKRIPLDYDFSRPPETVRSSLDHARFWRNAGPRRVEEILRIVDVSCRTPPSIEKANPIAVNIPGVRSNRVCVRAIDMSLIPCTFGYDNATLGHSEIFGQYSHESMYDDRDILLPHILG
ncbi:YcaO-like family protein [Corynebacterium pygosceleis]|uniref:YcaO-like family protein n=1 Tax=Corynebacterium pygosceleis TaxID=2800406 RepID=UPI0019066C36|nr:YcaO-like family protein [Corynebacterium pygosceleis]